MHVYVIKRKTISNYLDYKKYAKLIKNTENI